MTQAVGDRFTPVTVEDDDGDDSNTSVVADMDIEEQHDHRMRRTLKSSDDDCTEDPGVESSSTEPGKRRIHDMRADAKDTDSVCVPISAIPRHHDNATAATAQVLVKDNDGHDDGEGEDEEEKCRSEVISISSSTSGSSESVIELDLPAASCDDRTSASAALATVPLPPPSASKRRLRRLGGDKNASWNRRLRQAKSFEAEGDLLNALQLYEE